MTSRVGLGMLLFNGERYVEETLRSLLEQTFHDFALYAVDDGSTDGTWEIVRAWAAEDPRIRLFRNDTRVGQHANYLKTFSLGGGESEFWAWVSDHDRYHPEWLQRMVQALDDHPEAFLAYPLTVRISETGAPYPDYPSPRFDTDGLDMRSRIEVMREGEYRIGDMIYGLFRTEALEREGVFPPCLLPDVLLIWKLTRHGTIVQVPEKLWYRRFIGLFSVRRQRRNLFRRAPWYTFLAWPLVNTGALFRASVIRADTAWRERWEGCRLSAAFLSRYWPYVILSSRWLSRILERPIRFYLRWKRGGLPSESMLPRRDAPGRPIRGGGRPS